ncbi:DUF3857 domain-containing protein [Yeosuana marina]|uniref:DUF3857 domain-containing protein n=1 Tax=Yeosuana marina TaxID=1565536 RepID=UPI0030EB9826
MKRIILPLLFLNINLTSYSQENYSSESYRVTLNDISARTFEKDSTANALVIYEHGNSYVDKNEYDLRTEVQKKIKILNRDGFDKANITIYLYNNESREEKIKKIIATTYNLVDGNVIKTQLKESNIYREKYNENYTLVKFALPNIKAGSVITYSYTIISPFMFNYKSWNFQDDIPKLHSEYVTSIPANWDYHIKLIGSQKLSVAESKLQKNCLTSSNGGTADCTNSTYVMKNTPAFIEEDYMTAKSNYLARVEYELKTFQDFQGIVHNYAKTWETVDKELKTEPNIGRQLSKSVKADELLSNDILSEQDTLKKAEAIYKYVQENYAWNKEYNIFKDVSVKDLIKNKSGNVSSINILLHNLLEENGILVKPILLSTRDNGFATKLFPVISEFNYLIVQATINNKTYLLDATDDYLSFGEIPFRCLNLYGRLLDFKNGSEWVDIAINKPSSVFFKAEINIDENQTFICKVDARHTGYYALNARKSYYSNRDAYIEKLENNSPYMDIFDHNVTSNDKTSKDFIESYNIEYNPENTGDKLYLNPFFIKFFDKNPFKLQERTYPIDFGYKKTYLYLLKLNLGNSYSVLEQPKDYSVALPNNAGQINFSTKILNDSVNLIMKVDFKEPFYTAEYYPYLKEFMNKIVDIQKNSLILIKKI